MDEHSGWVTAQKVRLNIKYSWFMTYVSPHLFIRYLNAKIHGQGFPHDALFNINLGDE